MIYARLTNGGAMPTYLFECECGKVTEKQIRLDEGIAHTCECGKEARRVFTVIAAHFKGTGWGKD
jgi:putative FmdB family regulatory protein